MQRLKLWQDGFLPLFESLDSKREVIMAEHSCVHEDDFKRLEELVSKVFTKMDKFLESMHSAMVEEAVRGERQTRLEVDINHVAESLRSVNEQVRIIGDWRQRFEGGIKVMLAVPIFCTVITTGVAIYKMM